MCSYHWWKNWLIAKLFLTEVTGTERKRDSDDISEAEFSRQAVKKAAERFEKVLSEESSSSTRMPPPSLSSLGARGRSKSIGHSLAQKLQEADEELVKPVLPWAVSADDQVCFYNFKTTFGSKVFSNVFLNYALLQPTKKLSFCRATINYAQRELRL